MRVEHSWPDRGSVTIEVWQPSTFCAVSFPACFTSSLFLGRTSYPADEIGLGLQSPLPPPAVTAMFVCSLLCHSDLLIANLLQRRRLTVLLLFVIRRSKQAVWSICRNHRTPLKGSVVLFVLFETNSSSCG